MGFGRGSGPKSVLLVLVLVASLLSVGVGAVAPFSSGAQGGESEQSLDGDRDIGSDSAVAILGATDANASTNDDSVNGSSTGGGNESDPGEGGQNGSDSGNGDGNTTNDEDTDSDADETGDTNGTETLVVRFEPYGPDNAPGASDAAGTASVDALRTHANNTKAPFKQRFGGDGTPGASAASAVTIKREFWLANAAIVELDTSQLSEDDLLGVEYVERVHENVEIKIDSVTPKESTATAGSMPQASPTTTTEGFTDALDMIETEAAWDRFEETEPGAGATVAVLDTGIDEDHEDLTVEEWVEFDSEGEEIDSEPTDLNGHGTHVAGTVAGAQNPDGGGDSYGVAPGASLYGVKVLDVFGSGTFTQVIAGMQWATENEEVDVIQMSLGADGTNDKFVEPVSNARDNDTIVVASVGNDGEGTSGSPGNVFDSISVGAVDNDESVADFSGSQTLATSDWDDPPDEWPDEYDVPTVVAPGVSIESAAAGTTNGTDDFSGTSMAAPHVSGAIALILSATDGTPSESVIRRSLTESAEPPEEEDPDSDRFGNHGVIDADAAIEETIFSTVSGTITDSDGDPTANATVRSDVDGDPSTETDADGGYELSVPEGEQSLTVEAFGFNSETTEIAPGFEEGIEEDFELDLRVDAKRADGVPSRFAPGGGGSYRSTIEVANVESYEISFADQTRTLEGDPIDSDDVDIEIQEDDGAFRSISLDEPDTDLDPDTDTLTVAVTPDEELGLSRLVFNQTFTGSVPEDPTTAELPTGRTTIQGERVTVGERDLRDVSRFVDEGSTIEVDQATALAVDDEEPVGIELNRSLGLSGENSITVDESTTDEDPIGVEVTSDDVTIAGPTVEGDTGVELANGLRIQDTGLGTPDGDGPGTDGESVVNVENVTLTDSRAGLRIDDAASISGTNVSVTAADTGLSVTGSEDVTISNGSITVTDGTTGIDLDDGTVGAEIEATIDVDDGTDSAVSFGGTDHDANEVTTTFEGANRTEPIVVAGTNATVDQSAEPEAGDDPIRPTTGETDLSPLGVFLELDASSGTDNRIDLTVPYTEAEDELYDADTLAVYRFDDDTDEWEDEPVDGLDLDTETREISATVESFSTFGVYGEQQAFYTASAFSIDSPTDGEVDRDESLNTTVTITNDGGEDTETRTAELRVGSDVMGTEGDDYVNISDRGLPTLETDEEAEISINGTVPTSVAPGENRSVAVVVTGPDGAEGDDGGEISVTDRSLSGTVTADDTGDPIEDATVSVEITDGGFEETVQTDAAGEYSLDDLDDGLYDVSVDADEFGSVTVDVSVDRFEETVRNVELDPNPGSINGTIRDNETDEPIEDATVEAGGASVQADSNGTYQLDEIARGDRTVTVTAEGYATDDRTVSVDSNQTTTADFDLERAPVFSIEEVDVPASVQQEETLSIDVTVQNDGLAAGQGQVDIEVLGETDSETIELDTGNSTVRTVDRSVDASTDTGTYDVSVTTPDDTQDASFEVTSPDDGSGTTGSTAGGGGGGGGDPSDQPPDLRLQSVPSPSLPETATTGEEITVEFGLRNLGGTATDPVRVLADGDEIGRHDRFILSDSELEIEITHTFRNPGQYAIELAAPGLDGSDRSLGTIDVEDDPIDDDQPEDEEDGTDDPEQPDNQTDPSSSDAQPDSDRSSEPSDDSLPEPADQPGFGPIGSVIALCIAFAVAWVYAKRDSEC